MDEIQYVRNTMVTFHSKEIMSLWTFTLPNIATDSTLIKGALLPKHTNLGLQLGVPSELGRVHQLQKYVTVFIFLTAKKMSIKKLNASILLQKQRGWQKVITIKMACRSCENWLGADH